MFKRAILFRVAAAIPFRAIPTFPVYGLIYHHFGSKENLWKAVKERILGHATSSTVDFHHMTLKAFLEAFVTFRFQLYAQHPELVRLMGWQRLEPQGESLAGVTTKKFTEIDQEIIALQKAGEIRDDLQPKVVSYLILSMASSGFIDKADFLQPPKGEPPT